MSLRYEEKNNQDYVNSSMEWALAAPILNYTHPAALTVAGYNHRLLPGVSHIVEKLKKVSAGFPSKSPAYQG